jgi:GDP-mannose 4,6-dehydratase
MIEAIDTIRPDFIFHLAAQSYVPYSFVAPGITVQTNCLGTTNLLEAIRLVRNKCLTYDPVVHICSSSEVYGQVLPEEVPIVETTPFRPASPYAVSKVCEDMLGAQYFLSYGIKTIRTRMFTHTGPRRGDVFVESTFAKQIVEAELNLRRPIVYVGNLDSIRTFADVRDTVRAYWMLVNTCVPGEVYNIGGDFTESVGDMLNRLIKLSNLDDIEIQVDQSRLRPSDVTLQIPSSNKFKEATGWKPEITFEQTLLDLLHYWRDWYDRNNG